jgi:MOSC domain-containing protein YiiM
MEASPRVLSVNVGMPAPTLRRHGVPVRSGIVKAPALGPVPVHALGFEGDGHADLRVHGGPLKAVYAYPVEHYEFGRHTRPELEFPVGGFGENLTIQGIRESEVRPGDRLAIGTAELVVTQPRFPCEKLGLRFNCPAFVREFAEAGRPGFYLSVERAGALAAGDPIRWRAGDPSTPTIQALFLTHTG